MQFMKNAESRKFEFDPIFLSWVDLMRSHGYISLTIAQEKMSDLYDVKNPFVVQEVVLAMWLDQMFNQTNFSAALCNLGMSTLRRHGFMLCGTLEEEAYGVLS